MNTLVITPKSKAQEMQLLELAEKWGLTVGKLSAQDREDAALLRAMQEGERNPENVSLNTFLETLKGCK